MLLQKIKQEQICEYIYDILNSKDKIHIDGTLEESAALYKNCFYVNKEDFEAENDLVIYDEYGDIFMEISPPFIDEYSSEDYLINGNLYKELESKIKKIEDIEFLVLFD